ncbi:MAG: hypothetical protein NTV72_03475 [Candidatus Taylorbacteria bacterium]|nr:hypothetical protein [Candidatus Taylorbacteria bacterium]
MAHSPGELDKQSLAWEKIDEVRVKYKNLDERWKAFMELPESIRRYRIAHVGLVQFDRLAGNYGMRVNAHNYIDPDPQQRKRTILQDSAILLGTPAFATA